MLSSSHLLSSLDDMFSRHVSSVTIGRFKTVKTDAEKEMLLNYR